MKRRKTSISGNQIKNALDPRLPGGKNRLYVRCPSVCPSTETPNSADRRGQSAFVQFVLCVLMNYGDGNGDGDGDGDGDGNGDGDGDDDCESDGNSGGDSNGKKCFDTINI